MKVEDQCRSAWVSQVLEKQRCHFVHYLAHSSGSAFPKENAGPELYEGDELESILEALSPLPEDFSPMNSEEIAAAMKEYDEELSVVDKPLAPKQVLATLTNVEVGSSEANRTPP